MTRRETGVLVVAAAVAALAAFPLLAGGGKAPAGKPAATGIFPYEKFEDDATCAGCHEEIAAQHARGMMSRSFTHGWDEVEYFRLALPHALKEAKVAGVKAGCMGCHAPLAFLAGDIPPKPVAEKTRANDGVACTVCHSITGFTGDTPFNFNWTIAPGEAMQGTRPGVKSPHHGIAVNPFLGTAEFCGTCHNEKDPWGQWVKATHLEWKESPYGKRGIVCQDCHMTRTEGNPAPDAGGAMHADMRTHLFFGAHTKARLEGAVEVELVPAPATARPGDTIIVQANVINQKAGHMIPTGSAEERVVWLHVEAIDSTGKVFHLPVDRKGFEGEDYTISSPGTLAYQDLGEIMGLADFQGLERDGDVPAGDRIYRLPYLDPKGRMTVAQWNTKSFGPDYRLPPLTAVPETFTWKLPKDVAPGPVTIRATVWYSKLVSSVARFLEVPEDEARPVKMAETVATISVGD